jgi:hypothetical protein
MNPLDALLWSATDWLASRCTTTAFTLSLLAAIAAVGALETLI